MQRPTAFRGVHVVDAQAGQTTGPTTVIVTGGRVSCISPDATCLVPREATRVQADGTWLTPGLVDAHIHAHAGWVRRCALAHGVTALCDPAACPPQWCEPEPPSPYGEPRVVQAGPPLDFPPGTWPHAVFVTNEHDVREEVRRNAAQGFAFVKLYSGLPPELVRAGIDEAHTRGLGAIGDLVGTCWTDAAEAGIDMLCHVPQHADLLPPDARSAFARDLRKGRVHPLVRWAELVDYDADPIKRMIDTLLSGSVAVVPTLVAVEAALLAGSNAYRDTQRTVVERLPDDLQRMHRPPDTSRTPADHLQRAERALERFLELVGRLHHAGVRVLAGTDAPRPWVIPGASLHRELELLARAGVPAHELLRIVTSRNAAAIRLDPLPTPLAEGSPADFLLLERSPLDSPAAFRHLRHVVLGERVLTPSQVLSSAIPSAST